MFISELQAKQGKVDLTVEIVKKDNPREFDKDGRKGRVCNFMVKDKTGSIKLSLWNDDIDLFNVGDMVMIKNGYVSEWQGEKQLSTGKFGTIEKATIASEEKEIAKEIDNELEEIERKDESIEKLDRLEDESRKDAPLKGFGRYEEPSKKKEAMTLDELENSFDEDKDDTDEDEDPDEEEELSLIEEDVVDDESKDKKD